MRDVFCFNIVKSSLASSKVHSTTSNKYKVAPAFSTCANVLAMPSCSITSVASLIPAVSIKRNKNPSKFNCASMASRVVPAMSLTMARSSFNKALNNVLLPAFGLPASTNAKPFFITFPSAKESFNASTSDLMRNTNALSSSREANSTSSSAKSNSNSTKLVKCNNRSLSVAISRENPPFSCFKAKS